MQDCERTWFILLFKDNERFRKQVACLDASVPRLASIVEGKWDESLKKTSVSKFSNETF